MEQAVLTSIPIQSLVKLITESVVKSLTDGQTFERIHRKDNLITRKQAAQILQVSLPTLNILTKKGILNARRINSRVRYLESAVREAGESYNKFSRNTGNKH
jgi:hypothetical protein